MSSKKSRTGVVISLLSLFGLAMLLFYMVFRRNLISGNPKQRITSLLKKAGYSDNVAKWWAAVSAFETADWTSDLFKESNNLFGMKQPNKRATTSAGPTKSGFASFRSIEDSIQDLLLYLDDFNYPKDTTGLLAFIGEMKDNGYFEERFDTYYDGVKSKL